MRTIYMHVYKQEHEEKKGAKERAQVASEANLKTLTPLAVTSKRKPKKRGGGGAGNVVAIVATHCVGHSEWECGDSTDASVAASGVAQATWFANGRYVEARAAQEEAETAQEIARAIAAAADTADAEEESEVVAAVAAVAAAEAAAAQEHAHESAAQAAAAEVAAAQQAAEEEEELAALAQVAAAVAAGEEEEDEEEEQKYSDSQKNDAQAAEALFLSRFGLG